MMRFQSAFLFAIGIWLIGGVLGALFQVDMLELHRADKTQHSNPLLEIGTSQIIVNNLLVITVALLGFFTAGFTSTFVLLINGFICIFFIKLTLPFDFNLLNTLGIRCCYVILECLAIWVSSALGLMGLPYMVKLFSDSKFHIAVKDMTLIATAHLISILLVIIAGLLEGSAIDILKQQ